MLEYSRAPGPMPQLTIETFAASARRIAGDVAALQELQERELAGFKRLGVAWGRENDVQEMRRRVEQLMTALDALSAGLRAVNMQSTRSAESSVARGLSAVWANLASLPCHTPQVSLREGSNRMFSFATFFERRRAPAQVEPAGHVQAFCKGCNYDLLGSIGTIQVEETGRLVTSREAAQAALDAGHHLVPLCRCPDCNREFSTDPGIAAVQREALAQELEAAQKVLRDRGHYCMSPGSLVAFNPFDRN